MTELKLCNCAGCECELLGESCAAYVASLSKRHRNSLPSPVAGRILGRPYCKMCLRLHESFGGGGRRLGRTPAEENHTLGAAVRRLEDG